MPTEMLSPRYHLRCSSRNCFLQGLRALAGVALRRGRARRLEGQRIGRALGGGDRRVGLGERSKSQDLARFGAIRVEAQAVLQDARALRAACTGLRIPEPGRDVVNISTDDLLEESVRLSGLSLLCQFQCAFP